MVPVLFSIGPVSVYSFGLMLALAFLGASAVLVRNLEARGLDGEWAGPITWRAVLGGVVGARLLSVVNNWDLFLADPVGQLFTGAGFVFFGGLAGGLIAVSVWIYRQGLSWMMMADTIAPSVVLGQAVGRIGCQLAGDGDWGTVTTLPWGMAYPDAIFGWTHASGVLVHPAPVYESLIYSLIFVVLIRMLRAPERWRDGSVMFAFLALSGLARFVVEDVRIEPRIFMDLTEAQWIGLLMVVVGAVGVYLVQKSSRGLAGIGGILLLVLAGACTSGPPTAPDFRAQTLEGKSFRLSAQRGKVVLLNIFTTWCPPCREEMPSMQRLADQLADEDFMIVAVAEDDAGAPVVKEFGEELEIRFPLLTESSGAVGQSYKISGYPETFVIDRNGRQLARIIGPLDWDRPALVADLKHLIRTGEWRRGPDGRP